MAAALARRTLLGLAVLAAGFGLAPAGAADKPELTVYTYSGFSGKYGPGSTIKARFEEQCGCTLTFVTTDDSATLLSRLKLEGKGSKADVVLGLDTNLMAEAAASGLFQPHGLTPDKIAVPGGWDDRTFLPFDWGWFAFVYDKTRLAKPPASLKELVEGTTPVTILIEDPRTSTPGLGLLLWMQAVYGAEAPAMWAKLAPRIVTVTKGWSEAYGMFLKGEADMVLSYTTSPAYHILAEGKDQYAAAIFPEGHVAQVEIAGIPASARNPELARQFLTFMLSDRFQSAIPEGNWMYPAVTPAAGLPKVFAELPKPETTLPVAPEAVKDKRRAWIDAWTAALGR